MLKTAGGKVRKIFEQPVNVAIDAVALLFTNQDQLSDDDRKILAMVKAVLPADQAGQERAFSRFKNRLEKQKLSDRKISNFLEFLHQVAPGSIEDVLPVLKKYDPLNQKTVISNLLALSLENEGYRTESLELVTGLALKLGYEASEIDELAESIRQAGSSRAKIIRSGTGIVLALVVIGVFMLIATWLSSLLFGLVLAYIFLPLEQYFERVLKKHPGLLSRTFKKIVPVESIGKRFKRQNRFELSEEEVQRRKQQALTTKATTLTVSCVVMGSLALLLGTAIVVNIYVGNLKKRVINSEKTVVKTEAVQEKNAAAEVAGSSNDSLDKSMEKLLGNNTHQAINGLSRQLMSMLDNLKLRFQQQPLVQSVLDEMSHYLSDGKAEKQLVELLMKKSGGLFSFFANSIARIAGFLLNILLTFFFFSLLLSKLAAFSNSRSNSDQQATSYLIRTVFNGKWLPQMSEENLQEGDRIITEVCNKLRIWLRGYLTMMLIDFCVYTTVFTLLDVPYAPLLGAVAALGILLPYIGPVSSALLTVFVTLAVGGADVSTLQICGIIAAYLIHNGVIEQFFIYPSVIGESLGLSTLETIIVVLLGGIIAGIPGMIFALPAASVIKYLVPQIYRCWR